MDVLRASAARAKPLRPVVEEPLREQLWAHLMLGDALAAYQQCRRHLDERIGIEPHPSLKQLEAEILRQAPSLDWVAPAADVWLLWDNRISRLHAVLECDGETRPRGSFRCRGGPLRHLHDSMWL